MASNPYNYASQNQMTPDKGYDLGQRAYGQNQSASANTGGSSGPGPEANMTQSRQNNSNTSGLKPIGGTQNFANPDPVGQPNVDYINSDGTPHYSYGGHYNGRHDKPQGQGGGYGGQQQQGGGNVDPGYWNPGGWSRVGAPTQGQSAVGGRPGYTQQAQGAYSGVDSGFGGPAAQNRRPDVTQQAQGQPPTPVQYGNGPDYGQFQMPTNIDWWKNQENAQAAQGMYSTAMPYMQFQQNAYQYGNDFGEAQRRWDLQYGREGQQNQWQQGFSERQQGQAERQAQLAEQQWRDQFGYQQQQDQYNQGVDTRNFGETQRQFNDRMDLDRNQQGQAWANSQREAALRELQNTQQYGLDQTRINNQASQFGQQLAYQQQQGDRQYGLDTRGMDLQELQNQQRYGIDTRGMDLQELQNQQRYGLDQEQMNLNTLQNAQEYGLNRDRMSMQDRQFAQQLGLNQGELNANVSRWNADRENQRWQLQSQLGFSREELAQKAALEGRGYGIQEAQMAQQGAIERERMAQQERIATMQNYGRAQAPQARWVRNW